MKTFDLAISYTWEFDKEFINFIEKIFRSEGFSTFIITRGNLHEVIEKIKSGSLKIKAYLDRASDEDANFDPVFELLGERGAYIINPYFRIVKVVNKALMHPVLEEKGLNLPYSIIIPSFDVIPEIHITPNELSKLGSPFIIKPAFYSGGGDGVKTDARTIEDILEARKEINDDEYLLQRKIYPAQLDGKRAWFRSYWAFGEMFIVWWDDITHLYESVTQEEIEKFGLHKIFEMTAKIAEAAGIDYFSSEIAVTNENEFFLIDYINDNCDFRLQSNHLNGVPDEIVEKFIRSMVDRVKNLE